MLDFSYPWRGQGLLSDARSPNKKISNIHVVIVYQLRAHANGSKLSLKAIGPGEDQSLTPPLKLTLFSELT